MKYAIILFSIWIAFSYFLIFAFCQTIELLREMIILFTAAWLIIIGFAFIISNITDWNQGNLL